MTDNQIESTRPKPVVEHVWTQDRNSKIFEAIYRYFRDYSRYTQHSSSLDTHRPDANFRIYHRPHLETALTKPCACVIHHDLQDATSDFNLAKNLSVFAQSDLLFCLNNTQARQLKASGLNQCRVIPHGYHENLNTVRQNRTSKLTAERSPPWTLGIFSRRYPSLVKGEAFLYELLNHLSTAHFKFLLIGQDRDKDAAYLRRLGFEATHLPDANYDAIVESYKDLDALLVLSVAEGGPASAPESLAAGVPLFARPVGMIADIPAESGNVLTLTDDPVADAKAIEAYLSTGQHTQILTAPIPDYIQSWPEVIAAYETEILACIAKIAKGQNR